MMTKLKQFLFKDNGKVDLILTNDQLVPGEKITGEFLLKGPKNKKKVSRLECDLIKVNAADQSEDMIEIATTIYMSKVIDDQTWTKIPFSYVLPEQLQDRDSHGVYRFRTRLIYGNNVQCIDHDEIKIKEEV